MLGWQCLCKACIDCRLSWPERCLITLISLKYVVSDSLRLIFHVRRKFSGIVSQVSSATAISSTFTPANWIPNVKLKIIPTTTRNNCDTRAIVASIDSLARIPSLKFGVTFGPQQQRAYVKCKEILDGDWVEGSHAEFGRSLNLAYCYADWFIDWPFNLQVLELTLSAKFKVDGVLLQEVRPVSRSAALFYIY